MEGLPRPTKSAKTASSVPMSSLTDMSNVALRHTFRFADARTLAAAECLKPRLAQVARAAVVEAADKRHGVTLEAVPGCAWRLLVQEGLAGPGCVALAVDQQALFVGTDGRVRSWGNDTYRSGRLGHASLDEPVTVPRVIDALMKERITCVSVGASFSLVTTAAGDLYSFGSNSQGQCGLGHTNTGVDRGVNQPRKVKIEGAVESAVEL